MRALLSATGTDPVGQLTVKPAQVSHVRKVPTGTVDVAVKKGRKNGWMEGERRWDEILTPLGNFRHPHTYPRPHTHTVGQDSTRIYTPR